MATVNIPTKDEIIRILKSHPLIRLKHQVKRVYLIGSYAKGTHNESSDIDILIETSKRNKDLTQYYRKKLINVFVTNRIPSNDSIHPQWNGKRIDIYFNEESNFKIELK